MFPAHMHNLQEVFEEEELEDMRNYNIKRRMLRDRSDPFALREQEFMDLFRLNKEMGQYVFERIRPRMQATENVVAVIPVLRFFAALYFYATGSYQRTVGQSFNLSMSQQVVSKAVHEVSILIQEELAQEWIKFPTEEEFGRIKGRFMEATGFPGVIGAIDCTHVAIIAPQEEEHNYVNRKGYHSKNVQVICDYDLQIMNVNATYPGSTHDAFIWRMSGVQRILEQMYQNGNRATWLLGDSGYPQQPWLMTPVLHAPEGTAEFRYTERHIQARNCIERCFGVLKGRFRCLLGERKLRYDPQKVGIIFNVCCILHNICRQAHIFYNFDIVNYENVREQENANHEFDHLGNMARQNLIDRYFR